MTGRMPVFYVHNVCIFAPVGRSDGRSLGTITSGARNVRPACSSSSILALNLISSKTSTSVAISQIVKQTTNVRSGNVLGNSIIFMPQANCAQKRVLCRVGEIFMSLSRGMRRWAHRHGLFGADSIGLSIGQKRQRRSFLPWQGKIHHTRRRNTRGSQYGWA